MDEAGRDAVLSAVLAQHPDAHVFATSPAGLFVAMPDGLELTTHRPLQSGRSAVDLVVPDKQMAVMEAWWKARADGAANCLVRLAAAPERTVRMHIVDGSSTRTPAWPWPWARRSARPSARRTCGPPCPATGRPWRRH